MNPTKAAIKAQIARQVKTHEEKGPTYQLDKLRASHQKFRNEVKDVRARLQGELEALKDRADSRERRELLKRALFSLAVLLELHEESSTALESAVVVHDGSVTSQQVFSPESKKAAGTTADGITSFRTAVTDVATDGGEDARFVRDRCRVGALLNRTNPIDVKTMAAGIVRAVRGPAENDGADPELVAEREQSARTRQLLEDYGVDVEAFLPAIEEGLADIERQLSRAQGTSKTKARETRDRHQLEVELINARILVTVNGAAGIAARDALRDLLPKTTAGQRAADRSGQESGTGLQASSPGPVASGAAAAPAGAPATATPASPAPAANPTPLAKA